MVSLWYVVLQANRISNNSEKKQSLKLFKKITSTSVEKKRGGGRRKHLWDTNSLLGGQRMNHSGLKWMSDKNFWYILASNDCQIHFWTYLDYTWIANDCFCCSIVTVTCTPGCLMNQCPFIKTNPQGVAPICQYHDGHWSSSSALGLC